jgi:phage/plasmid-associated DNA primase
LAAAISEAPVEVFINDEGVGGNGKGFITALTESVMGDLAWQLKEAMLVQKPPGAESPSPALLELRGRRMLAAPEVESTMRMQSAWLKRLCDQTTVWHARELYAKREVAFKLRAIFCVSTNQPLKFTSLDGGVARRGINVSYPFVFKHDPKEESEKPLRDELKDPEYLAARRAGYLYLILKAVKAFFGDARPGLRPLPAAVEAATETMMRAEFAEAVREFLDDMTKEILQSRGAFITRHELIARMQTDCRLVPLHISKADLRDALAQVCEFVTVNGKRECVKHKERRHLLGWKT